MIARNARLVVLPRAVATELLTTSFSRACWFGAAFILMLEIPVLFDTLARLAGARSAVAPTLCLIALFALCWLAMWRPSRASRLIVVGVGGILVYVFAVSVLAAAPTLAADGVYLLNRPAIVLVIVSPGIVRPLQMLPWIISGYLVASLSIVAAELTLGVTPRVGLGPTFALIVTVASIRTIVLARRASERLAPDLERLHAETSRLALEHEYEVRAAAMVHDTVLSDLTAIMNSTGALDSRMRERFRSDVALLTDGAWLRESRDAITTDTGDAVLRNGMLALISDMQWRGLTVDITGNPEEEVVRLSAKKIAAVHAAVRACLDNVLQHAGVDSAELVLGASDDSVTVMVIDHGVGFDPASIGSDRLGLRSSVVRRIETLGGSVRVWSSPDNGTSVMMTMPCEFVVGGDDVTNY